MAFLIHVRQVRNFGTSDIAYGLRMSKSGFGLLTHSTDDLKVVGPSVFFSLS